MAPWKEVGNIQLMNWVEQSKTVPSKSLGWADFDFTNRLFSDNPLLYGAFEFRFLGTWMESCIVSCNL